MSKRRLWIAIISVLIAGSWLVVNIGTTQAVGNPSDPTVAQRPINITQKDLEDAHNKWNAQHIPEYTMNIQCSGWMEYVLNKEGDSPCGEWQLQVATGSNDKIIEKMWLIQGDVISTANDDTLQHLTVSGLFEAVDKLLKRTHYGSAFDKDTTGEPIHYVVRFNIKMGYPMEIIGYAPPSKLIPALAEKNQISLSLRVNSLARTR